MGKRIAKFLLKILLWFFVGSIGWVLLYGFVPVPFTPLMVINSFKGDSDYQIRHEWTPIEDISINIQLAVICAEDQRFVTHHGFDYTAIREAWTENKEGKRIRGGSTISQQTAKNVFLWPGRTWLRKGLEVYFTFLIETFWSKERILEVYLNSVEMGEGVFGVQAAAGYWFNTSAKGLSQHQSAAIAAILPNPSKYKASPRTSYIEKRKAWVLRQMQLYGPLNLDRK